MSYWTDIFLQFDAHHKDLFNEEGWRKSVTTPHMRWAETGNPPNTYVTGDVGTLYHDYGDGSAHYMAFHVTGPRSVLLMDPSGGTGPYAASPEEEAMQRAQFPRRSITHMFPGRGPQHVDADTLCQTWSLGFLFGMNETLTRAASRPRAETAEDEAEEIFDEIRHRLTSHPDPRARKWIQLYSRARPHLREYFRFNIPHSTRPPRRNLLEAFTLE